MPKNKEYISKCVTCRQSLKRMMQNLTIDLGKFTVALLYVLQEHLGKSVHLYGTSYGEIEFSVHTVRFRLLFQPRSPGIKLVCKHLEGNKYIDARLILRQSNILDDFTRVIERCVYTLTPFSGEENNA